MWSDQMRLLSMTSSRRQTAKTVAIGLLVAGLCASPAFAQSGLQPVQSMLQTIIGVLTGPIASMLAIVAVIGCGFLAWTGRFTWGIAGSVILGIVLVFGSSQIVAFFQGALGN
jgi:type IV secretion system protein VirB2